MNKTTLVAIEAVTKAGKFLSRKVLEKQTERIKERNIPADIVTESDLSTEKLILDIIHKNFPTHAILSEETSKNTNPTKHKNLWIVDPIDGTISFAAGLPYYTVSVAYAREGVVISSALFMAQTNEVLWGQTGKGAFSGNTKLHIKNLPWEKSIIGFDPGIRKRKIAMEKLAPRLSSGIRWLFSSAGSAYMLGLVAKGNFQGMVSVFTSPWDYAAGVHIIRESGGVVTDFLGREFPQFTESGYVACAPNILPSILKHTKRVAGYFTE